MIILMFLTINKKTYKLHKLCATTSLFIDTLLNNMNIMSIEEEI